MSLTLIGAFALASAGLMLILGPNVAYLTSVSAGRGLRRGFAALAGSLASQALQLSLVVWGLAAMLSAYGAAFETIRWLGVVELVWLGVKALRTGVPKDAGDGGQTLARNRAVGWQGFWIGLANPKTLAFHAAFFPQFIDPAQGVAVQFWALAGIYLALAAVIDAGWVLVGRGLGRAAARLGAVWRNRAEGALLLTAAAGLALVRRSET
ncbi:MAG: LysE family translocator [Maricaulaceae bacterium]